MRNEVTGEFQWSAWDRNKWDHYHADGVQIRFYREMPSGSAPITKPLPNFAERIFSFLSDLSRCYDQ